MHATGDPAERVAVKLTLTVIREELGRIVGGRHSADPDLHYLERRRHYAETDADTHPLPDGLHPDAAPHQLMGERVAPSAAAHRLRSLAT